MSAIQLVDRMGKTMDLLQINGGLYPRFDLDSVKNAFSFPARPDDIFICAYTKSGTHWTFEIIRFLLEGTTDLPLTEKMIGMVEFAAPSKLEELPSPRNLNTHCHFGNMSPEVFRNKSKIIYITRDPRDVAVSFYNHHKKFESVYHYDGDWQDYLPQFLEGKMDYDSWFEYTRGWEQGMKENPDHPFLVLSYEDLIQDPLREIRRIAEFIGVQRSDEFLEEVQEKTSFDSMAGRRIVAVETEFANSQVIYRKGKIGDWKNWFTVAQSEMFNEVFERKMIGTEVYKLYSHRSNTPSRHTNGPTEG